MEAVAAIASIAGILSLAGQAVDGIIVLRGFFQSCASESHSIERFLKRLNDLIQIVEHARDLMTKLEGAPSKIVPESILASLQIQLYDCNKDVYKWLSMAKASLLASNTGAKAAFKKFLVGLERQRITDIYGEISAHKDNIMTKLSVIGRFFDIDQSATLETICTRLKAWDEFKHLKLPVNGEKQDTMVSSDEIVSQRGSSSSLASIAESLSRIEDKMGDFVGTSRSQSGSQPRSIGSFDSSSVSGGRGIGWSSGASPHSTFTTPHSHDGMTTSLSERITRSLLGIRSDTTPSVCQHVESICDEGSNDYNLHGADGHLPQDRCLSSHYDKSTQESNKGFIQEATKYIDLILLAEAIIFKIRLFKTMPSTLFSLSDQTVQSEIDTLEAQLYTISSEAKTLQISCWKKGFNTLDLDSYIARCRKPESDHQAISCAVTQKTSSKGDRDVSVLANGRLRLQKVMDDFARNDRINMWLLSNLEASSKEMKLHRSFLPNAENLDKEQWSRMVLKYWLLDEAATAAEDKCFSSNGAVNSDGMCHSERVLFENVASSGLDDFDDEKM